MADVPVYDEITSNRRRSALLIAAFAPIVALVGWASGRLIGMGTASTVFALVFSAGSTALAYWKSDAIALAVSHARPADQAQYPRLHNLVEGLCIAGGLPKPRIYVIDDPAPNAFATGRNPRNAAIAVTTGLLDKMNRLELEGVLAHELAHIKNYDILVSTLAVTMVGTVALLSDLTMRFLWWGGPSHRHDDRDDRNGNGAAIFAVVGIVLLIVMPLVARLMQFAVSRRREALADISGVALTRYPPGLISALEKLRDDQTVVHSASKATAHLWIESPIPATPDQAVRGEGRFSGFNKLFLTHPPLEERIAALREL